MFSRLLAVFLALMCSCASKKSCHAQESSAKPLGQLLLIGGGLGVSNRTAFLDLIEAAGGREKARFVLLPTANLSIESARYFQKELEVFGIAADQVTILDVMHTNAQISTKDPTNIDKIDQATAVYMTGGDQVRLVRALTNSDGSDTPLLAAMRRLYKRGGVIAGTSAGASAQSSVMLAASGLPSMLVDEGLDALDYGLTNDSTARGILITKGLGFLEQGVVDQHFLQYRGRLGRLSRVALEQKLSFGIGIDRDSAVRVDASGKVIVTSGRAIIVLPSKASFRFEPLGFSMENMIVSLLSTGDVFDPANSSIAIHSSKHEIAKGGLTFDGGFLITDIGSGYAVASALIGGLAENTQDSQQGVVLQFHDTTSHGYRYTFQKTPVTTAYYADSLDGSLHSIVNVQLSIAPIANGLNPSATQAPIDVQDLPSGVQNAVRSVAFRGLLPTNLQLEFRPNDAVTRREFAIACVRSVHLNAPSKNRPMITDQQAELEIELLQALETGFLTLQDGNLNPSKPVSHREAKSGLERLAQLSVATPNEAFQASLNELAVEDRSTITRSQLATLLMQLRFPQWSAR